MLYQLNYWRVDAKRLASLFVQRVMTAPGAILLDLHTIRHVCLVLGGRIVATLALGACKGDESTHESITSKYRPVRARWDTIASAFDFCQCKVVFQHLSADTLHKPPAIDAPDSMPRTQCARTCPMRTWQGVGKSPSGNRNNDHRIGCSSAWAGFGTIIAADGLREKNPAPPKRSRVQDHAI